MKKFFAIVTLVFLAVSCTPDTNVAEESSEYDQIRPIKIDQQATDKDDVPTGGDKGDNGDGEN